MCALGKQLILIAYFYNGFGGKDIKLGGYSNKFWFVNSFAFIISLFKYRET